jgi:hypothetical protein
MKMIALTIAALLTGCAGPVHYYGTEGMDEEILSSFSYQENEIKILEVDGERYLGRFYEDVYLKPGTHKFTAKLTWLDLIPISGIYLSKTTESSNLRVGCLDMKPGHKYHLYARDPGPDWRFVYHDKADAPYSLVYDAIPMPACQ